MFPEININQSSNNKMFYTNTGQSYINDQNILDTNDQEGTNNQTAKRKVPQKRSVLTEEEKQNAKKSMEKIVKENMEIIKHEEITIQTSLFFRLYVSGTIEYGNVSLYIH